MTHNDKPTVDFNLAVYRNEIETTPFVVVHGGKPWTFPHLDDLDGWGVAEAFAGGESGVDIELLKLALGKEYADFRAADRLKHGQMKALLKRYLAHCGIDVGN